jgi:hypothetical protein
MSKFTFAFERKIIRKPTLNVERLSDTTFEVKKRGRLSLEDVDDMFSKYGVCNIALVDGIYTIEYECGEDAEDFYKHRMK